MDTKWLEDLVSLAKTRSFSQSAKLRQVTQPAFSRRIKALEAWAGSDLVDRSTFPPSLTMAGQTLYPQAIEILQCLHTSRAMLKGHASNQDEIIDFAIPHTLALTFFPQWIKSLQSRYNDIKTRVSSLNVHDAAMRLVEGGCDFLIAYHHPSQPLHLDTEKFDMLLLGKEMLAPYCAFSETGSPLFELPSTSRKPSPFLAYATGAYLGHVVDYMINEIKIPLHLKRVYETDMSESLKVMALEGHGIAFLPYSAVHKEVKDKKLIQVRLNNGPRLEVEMEIRIYREKTNSHNRFSESASALWKKLSGEIRNTQHHLR
jgi:DNA-binding transcriptional LysR family regulator